MEVCFQNAQHIAVLEAPCVTIDRYFEFTRDPLQANLPHAFLQCGLCDKLKFQPMVLSCGHSYCARCCVTKRIPGVEDKINCIWCGAHKPFSAPPAEMTDFFDHTKVSCINYECGCTDPIYLKDIRTHEDTCPCTTIQCPVCELYMFEKEKIFHICNRDAEIQKLNAEKEALEERLRSMRAGADVDVVVVYDQSAFDAANLQ